MTRGGEGKWLGEWGDYPRLAEPPRPIPEASKVHVFIGKGWEIDYD